MSIRFEAAGRLGPAAGSRRIARCVFPDPSASHMTQAMTKAWAGTNIWFSDDGEYSGYLS